MHNSDQDTDQTTTDQSDAMTSEDKFHGRLNGEQPEAEPENMAIRFLYVVIIAIMVSVSVNILGLLAVIQFVIMMLNNREPNENLANFGTDLGVWIAKATRYLVAASDVKPWPWTEID